MNRTMLKGLAAGTGAAAALLAPLALAGPAQATPVTKDGCTVTAGTPYFAGTFNSAGTKEVKRLVTATCDEDLRVTVDSEFWEEDIEGRAGDGDPDNDRISEGGHTFTFYDGQGRRTKTATFTRALPQPPLDSDTSAEVYHYLRFQVKSGDSGSGVLGSWSAWQYSPVFTIFYA